MPARSLTVASVARIKPPRAGQADYFDQGSPGLALRVSYGGAKAWTYFYRRYGKLHRLSLGRYPGMSLPEARDAWRAARLAVSKGESPAHIRPTTADSFAAVADEWLKRDQAHNRSAAEVRRVIERDINPAWGDRLIAAITRRDAIELIDRIADRGALTMARRIHSHLHRLFRWSVGRGIIENNPMADLPKHGSAVKRDRVLTDSELAAVWKAAGKIGWPFGPAVQLLGLTAARRDEIASLRWSEIHGDEIRIPGERSKTTDPRSIPLSLAAAKVDRYPAPHWGRRLCIHHDWQDTGVRLVEGQAAARCHGGGDQWSPVGAVADTRSQTYRRHWSAAHWNRPPGDRGHSWPRRRIAGRRRRRLSTPSIRRREAQRT